MQVYSDPSQAADKWALPDVEVFHVGPGGWSPSEWQGDYESEDSREMDIGWYYWYCLPGCLPDSEPFGPFATEAEAIAAAQED